MKYKATVNRHRNACEMLKFLQASSPTWDDLYQRQTQEKKRYFTSFEFLVSWLVQWPENVSVSSSFLYANGDCVGVTFFSETVGSTFSAIECKTLHLCRSGLEEVDKIWPEYIEPVLAVPPRERPKAWAYWLEEILAQTGAHQMYQHVSPERSLTSTAEHLMSSRCLIENREDGPIRILREDRKTSSSLRRKISQTSRKLSLMPSALKLAKDEETLLAAFEKIKKWHLQKWEGSDTPSGFENELFNATLKQELLSSLHRRDSSAKARCYYIEHEGHIIGGTILLEESSWVGFYLAGYKPFNDNHIHLGVWMHIQLIEAAKSNGMLQYDFMAGDDAYKKMFSNSNTTHARARWVKKYTIYSCLLLIKEKVQGIFINKF